MTTSGWILLAYLVGAALTSTYLVKVDVRAGEDGVESVVISRLVALLIVSAVAALWPIVAFHAAVRWMMSRGDQ